jgi:aspartate 1-decarboxylase
VARKLLHAKLHHARVDRCEPEYVGSLTIDSEIMAQVGIRPNEAVTVSDVDNGARFETYALAGEWGSREFIVNGGAAHLVNPGDRLIVMAFEYVDGAEMDSHQATVLVFDERNRVARTLTVPSRLPTKK